MSSRPWMAILWLLIATALLAAGGALLWTYDTRRGGVYPEYSVFRTDAQGAAVAFRLLKAVGARPQVWDRDFGYLREPGLMILVAPPAPDSGGLPLLAQEPALLPTEIEALDAWVRKGNGVVVFGKEESPLHRALGLILEPRQARSRGSATPMQPSLLARGVADLRVETPAGFEFGRRERKHPLTGDPLPDPPLSVQPIPAPQWLPLFGRLHGRRTVPLAVAAARGRGLYVFVGDAFPVTNEGIVLGDNARFLLNLAALTPPGGSLWFDEYHRRPVERGLVAYLRQRALTPLLIYALLLGAIAAWRLGARFGAPEPLVADPRRDSGEYVRAVAALYRNAGLTREATLAILADFQRRWGLTSPRARAAAGERLARRYEAATGRPGDEIHQLLSEAERLTNGPKLTEREALQLCARLCRADEILGRRTQHDRRR